MINIEWKAPLFEITLAETRLRELGASPAERLVQVDTYFRVPQGRLKLREGVRGGELIRYNRDEREPLRRSEYQRVPVAQAAELRETPDAALGVLGRVEKHRVVWMVGDVRVHLDRVQGLGDFIEVEAPAADGDEGAARARAERLLASLDLSEADCIAASYIDLVTGATPWTS